MDLLVDRMERSDRQGVPAFLSLGASLNDRRRMDRLVVPGKGCKQPGDSSLRKDDFQSPLIAINDIPLHEGLENTQNERSMVDLQDYFVDYDENAMVTDSDTDNENVPHYQHQHSSTVFDYSAADSGKFSDLDFNYRTSPKSNSLLVSHSPCKITATERRRSTASRRSSASLQTRRDSLFLSTPNSAVLKNSRSMSSHFGCHSSSKKRLVNQFLRSSDAENDQSNSNSNSRRDSGSASLSYPRLQNMLYEDSDTNSTSLLPSQSSVNIGSLLIDSVPESSRSSVSSSIVAIPEVKALQFRTVDYGLNDKSKDKKKTDQTVAADDIDSNLYYEKHIDLNLIQLQTKVTDILQNTVLYEEDKFHTMLQHFDKMSDDYNNINEMLHQVSNLMHSNYKREIQDKFNPTDKDSFQSKLDGSMADCVEDLQKLETRMKSCQDKLSSQKETIRRLNNLLVVENSLLELDKNTKTVFRYRYFMCDVVILSIFVYFIKSYFNLHF